MATEEPWTIKRLLEWTTDYLKRSGADSPRLDAEILLGNALHCSRIQLYTQYDSQPSEAARAMFREQIKQRAQGKPVAYLTGEREFFSIPFRVTPQVLIPRPETEFVVVGALDALKAMPGNSLTVLDLGTGSGAIAIAIAVREPRARVVAVDRSPGALEVARSNVDKHHLGDRVECREGDLFSSCLGERFHVIASNPPYIGLRERADLPRDVIDHEPQDALFSGEDGSDLSLQLIAEAPDHLLPNGMLLIETSPLIAEKLTAALQNDSRYSQVAVRKDLAGHPRVLSARCNAE